MAGEDYLLEFYGTECPHCITMQPLIERLEKEEGLKLTKYEVWHNAANAALLAQYDQDYCGGVPFFYNKRSGKWICGSTTYEKFRDWAKGK
ncbi:thioredoxin family protein [Candidatus Micrarchaeota archaeon]|nr:thioredoxin family protein [Candidatus Micrarchaeota archaeon]